MTKRPVKEIRKSCLECCGGSREEVKRCLATRCPYYAFRFGKNTIRGAREEIGNG